MEKRTKITEIKETYTQKRRVRNENGEYEFKDVTLTRFKPVNYVSGWPRFGSFLLDLIFITIFETIVGMAIGVFLLLINQIDWIQSSSFDLWMRVLTWVFIRPLFYVIFEGSASATPAKLILGRVVVNEYGEKPTLGQIIGRAYGRMVPFEAFSCLSTLGWHDEWSKTFVLRKKDLQELKLALKVQEFDKPETSDSMPDAALSI